MKALLRQTVILALIALASSHAHKAVAHGMGPVASPFVRPLASLGRTS